ncbi:MAG: hypothetical protein IE923_11110 [Micrococcales bacterium]|nr:hypothetical protein [Micrococcales bacterium]
MTGDDRARVPGPGVPAGVVVRRTRTHLPAVLAALAAVAVLAAGTTTGAARVVLHQCVRLDEPLAALGIRLSLLQDVADCPTGTLAVTPDPSHGAVLTLGLVLPVLAAHAALAAAGAGLTALLLRLAGSARRVLGAVVHALPRPAGPQPASAPQPLTWLAERSRPARVPRERHPHRGPPPALA